MTQNNPLIKIFAPIIAFLILSLSLSVFVVRENETVFLIERLVARLIADKNMLKLFYFIFTIII